MALSFGIDAGARPIAKAFLDETERKHCWAIRAVGRITALEPGRHCVRGARRAGFRAVLVDRRARSSIQLAARRRDGGCRGNASDLAIQGSCIQMPALPHEILRQVASLGPFFDDAQMRSLCVALVFRCRRSYQRGAIVRTKQPGFGRHERSSAAAFDCTGPLPPL